MNKKYSANKTSKEVPDNKQDKTVSKNKRIKSSKKEPEQMIVKTTVQIEMPDKTVSPEMVFYRKVNREKKMGLSNHS